MPWNVSGVVEKRRQFVAEHESGDMSMAELCRVYGISRETGYAVLRRYRSWGWEGLEEHSRAAERHPNQTPKETEEQVLALRRAHMRWGPRKLKAVLERDEGERKWPAASTMGGMLAREGLVAAGKKRRRTEPYTQPLQSAREPNRVWCADFKGWFRTGDGERVDPLTLTDACSRYLLRCQAVERTNTERTKAIFEAAFREYGMPQAIRTDNGAPFASRAIAGLSRLSVWWIKLGIRPERIAPGHPEQNGRHERMHRTLKQETASPPAPNRRAQQRALDQFRHDYNQVRPHEALGMKTPASCYQASPYGYPERVPEPDYDRVMEVRKVRERGDISWRGHRHVFLTEALFGERVGFLPVDDRYYTVFFAVLPIALFDSYKLQMMPLPKENTDARRT
jgi:transposase InsO family protein